ncbi:MAG: DNA recombination protein RmuC [Lentisphaerae bacterium]|nr:DNA recombination protein RmuC [Lentisphaerota bacterium]
MSTVALIIVAILAAAAGLLIGWLAAAVRHGAVAGRLQAQIAALEQARAADGEKLAWSAQADARLREAFDALAAKALHANADAFTRQTREQLDGALNQIKGDWSVQREQFTNLVQPVERTLKALDDQVRQLEQKREGAYRTLEQHIGELKLAHRELRDETGHLRAALTTNARGRGQWGELQLRRIVEMAGMANHVDFEVQVQAGDQRPDMLIQLPNGGLLPVDAKTPLEHFLQATEALDEATRRARLKSHAAAMRTHVTALGRKEYWKQFERTPEVVVMFVPNEACLSASYEEDPQLLEDGLRQHVLLATPVTLYGLLKSIAYGWQQQAIADNARQIAGEGHDLCERLAVFLGHLQKTGRSLDAAVRSYNDAVGSAESRLLPSARRFRELGVTTQEVVEPEPVERQARLLNAGEEVPPAV